MSRRDTLLGMVAMAGIAYARNAVAAIPGDYHSEQRAQNPHLLDARNNCLDKGQRWITHCPVSFKEGDLELAECAANSEYTQSYASICEQVCDDCEKERMKHKEHIGWKACGEACAEVVDQTKLKLE